MNEYYFLKRTDGYLMDEIPESRVEEFEKHGWFIETIQADHRWEAHRSAEEWNCKLLHHIIGTACRCGQHDF